MTLPDPAVDDSTKPQPQGGMGGMGMGGMGMGGMGMGGMGMMNPMMMVCPVY
jgi:hypothetical protein